MNEWASVSCDLMNGILQDAQKVFLTYHEIRPSRGPISVIQLDSTLPGLNSAFDWLIDCVAKQRGSELLASKK
jgi:hypothetical protein